MICNTWSAATGNSYDSTPVGGGGRKFEEPHGLFGGVGQRPGVIPEHPNSPDKDGDGGGDGERKPPTAKQQEASHMLYPQLQVPNGGSAVN
jgi:hypothetical protein